jgi:3-hydroxyisobutyrate dehydrogenase-like beta-hydroxyacid dehydrogenase
MMMLIEHSKPTQARAKAHNVDSVNNDIELVEQCDYILSIVPPRDAQTIAGRIKTAAASSSNLGSKKVQFVDLNAVSPTSSKETFKLLEDSPHVVLYDGVISGGVPAPTQKDAQGNATKWHCPTLLMSGPNKLSEEKLVRVLNIEHMSDKVGAAVAVKMCFGMATKGYIALAIQSFTTAYRLGVLEELEAFLGKYKPAHLKAAQEGLVRMPHTAYRWVFEMLEMAETASEYGGFEKKL